MHVCRWGFHKIGILFCSVKITVFFISDFFSRTVCLLACFFICILIFSWIWIDNKGGKKFLIKRHFKNCRSFLISSSIKNAFKYKIANIIAKKKAKSLKIKGNDSLKRAQIIGIIGKKKVENHCHKNQCIETHLKNFDHHNSFCQKNIFYFRC